MRILPWVPRLLASKIQSARYTRFSPLKTRCAPDLLRICSAVRPSRVVLSTYHHLLFAAIYLALNLPYIYGYIDIYSVSNCRMSVRQMHPPGWVNLERMHLRDADVSVAGLADRCP